MGFNWSLNEIFEIGMRYEYLDVGDGMREVDENECEMNAHKSKY